MTEKQMKTMLKKVITAVLEKYGEKEGEKILTQLHKMMEGLKEC